MLKSSVSHALGILSMKAGSEVNYNSRNRAVEKQLGGSYQIRFTLSFYKWLSASDRCAGSGFVSG